MVAIHCIGCLWAYLDHPRRLLGGLYHSAKCGCNQCSSFKNMKVQIFGTFGWKTTIHASKGGVLAKFDPLNGYSEPDFCMSIYYDAVLMTIIAVQTCLCCWLFCCTWIRCDLRHILCSRNVLNLQLSHKQGNL